MLWHHSQSKTQKCVKENNPNVTCNREQSVSPSEHKQSSHIICFPHVHLIKPHHEPLKEREERRSCEFQPRYRKILSPGILVRVHQPVTPQCKSSHDWCELRPEISWSIQRCSQRVWATPKALGAPLWTVWSSAAVLQVYLLNGSTLRSVLEKPWENSDKTGKSSPALWLVGTGSPLDSQCCPPQQWGMVLHPVHLSTAPVKVQNHNCVSAGSIWVTVLGMALGFLLTTVRQGHWQNVPEVLGVVAMAWGAVRGLGTSPGRGFVEVTNPSQLTSTTHMSN